MGAARGGAVRWVGEGRVLRKMAWGREVGEGAGVPRAGVLLGGWVLRCCGGVGTKGSPVGEVVGKGAVGSSEGVAAVAQR